jgi:quinol-cytochrome oxidoreductase complex cytochrome b subunit/coenzyme F420-reducing hydrogenase delta subunit
MKSVVAIPGGWNPLDHLGAISFYLFWIVAVTGLYLFVFFETSISGAWQSVEAITNEQFYIGSLMRSLHRYASSAMSLTVTAHLLKELWLRRFSGARWFSWITGVPLLWFMFASAIGGYWLVWDERAEYIAIVTASLFDALPIVVEPMAFGLIDNATVSDRFFSLLIFVHIGVPLGLLLGMFIHIKRVNNAKTMPPRELALWILGSLTLLSLVAPALSLAPADLDRPLHTVEIDWFYMNVYPLIESEGPVTVWGLLAGVTVGLLVLPLFSREEPKDIAVVDPEYCNGCGWCFADCPYEAIYMKPHDFRPNHEQAVVITDNCVGCGICAGACPSATPFKSLNQAFSGIDLAEHKNTDILVDLKERIIAKDITRRIVVVGCRHGVDISGAEDEDVTTVELECIGQLPPSYMDYLCRKEDVEAVLLTGCRSGDCFHRLGIEIQEQRLVRLREPHVKFADTKERIEKFWVGQGGESALFTHLSEIRAKLREVENEAV